ncbi:FecR domain-containing protein [Chitinophaga sancti]|uniref:FecR domain-containing protein n=1 Tax=Chitinophaga sancti TaxID=1004 RepID=A0A1K1Q8S7_9BACT|nr:FecR domain-containing protein [Chitinophaga sancti]WQD61252.1 FecR domain-containing protein [Chitinophaga sancti]WQG86621.1 FecR domain-containing protein [Chitinophaga sancti]SFW56354.1 FecR family protein [Chitinophaga sancti]
MINEEQFNTLAARKLAGEATAEELQELDVLLQENDYLQEQFNLLQSYFTVAPYHAAADTELALQKTMARIHAIPTLQSKRTVWKWLSAAAAMLILGAGLLYVDKAHTPVSHFVVNDTMQWLHRQNGKATRASIELADGSKIWLNVDSKLTYPEVFNSNSREVYLTGEAFFDIAPNPGRPFIIHLANGSVHVLGTSFNIRAYENEAVQTSVQTGKVAFIPADNKDTVFITPDEKVIYQPTAANTIIKEPTAAEDDKAWTEGRLVFRDKTLEEIGIELERTFGKKISFIDDAPRHYRLTGSFQNNNLQDIMYYLARSISFHYNITDSTLLISE